MAPRLAAVLPECTQQGWRLLSLRVDQVRRSASRHRNPVPLTLVYEVQLQHPATQARAQRRCYAKLWRDGPPVPTPAGALALPELGLLLWPAPADPGLPQLAALLDPRQADAWWPHPAQSAELLRHEPELRATLRYAAAEEGASAPLLFAKTFADDRGPLIHERFSHFWQQAQQDPRAPLVAEPRGYCPRTRTVWQAGAPGRPLLERLPLLDPAERQALPERLAHALAAVHEAPHSLLGTRVRDTAHWLQEVHRRRRKIARVAPELAATADAVALRLEATAPREPVATVIHGDFHPDQVWLHNERVVLFDFDEFVLGDPMEDLAEFVTKLGSAGRAGELALRLRAACARRAPQHFSATRLHWHLAVQSLLQAGRAFKFQRPRWRDEVRQHLQQAAALTGLVMSGVMEVAS